MTNELQRLKQEMRERGQARPQDEEIINALREQVGSCSYLHTALYFMLLHGIYRNYSETMSYSESPAVHACLFIKCYATVRSRSQM